MLIPIYCAIILSSAVLAIHFRLKENHKLFGVFKGLTTSMIIGLTVFFNLENEGSYGWIILVGLIFSLIGDLLLLENSRFIFGLGSFLVAHILFIFAFSSLHGFQHDVLVLGILLIIGAIYFKFLFSSLKSFKLPVALYILAIIILDWQAFSLALFQKHEVYLFIGFGALLFTFSDAILAYKKFKNDFKLSEVWILSTYWLAIFLFCMSVGQMLS